MALGAELRRWPDHFVVDHVRNNGSGLERGTWWRAAGRRAPPDPSPALAAEGKPTRVPWRRHMRERYALRAEMSAQVAAVLRSVGA